MCLVLPSSGRPPAGTETGCCEAGIRTPSSAFSCGYSSSSSSRLVSDLAHSCKSLRAKYPSRRAMNDPNCSGVASESFGHVLCSAGPGWPASPIRVPLPNGPHQLKLDCEPRRRAFTFAFRFRLLRDRAPHLRAQLEQGKCRAVVKTTDGRDVASSGHFSQRRIHAGWAHNLQRSARLGPGDCSGLTPSGACLTDLPGHCGVLLHSGDPPALHFYLFNFVSLSLTH